MLDTFENRDEYHRMVVDRVRSRITTPGIVFLDPDTGLASQTPSLDHVLDSELATLWAELKAADVLVFYQPDESERPAVDRAEEGAVRAGTRAAYRRGETGSVREDRAGCCVLLCP